MTESTQTSPFNVGFSASHGALRTHQENSGYACHLVPRLERGGRHTTASHQSRHRTLPRPPGGLAAKPQQSRTIRTIRPYRAALRDRHPKPGRYLPRRLFRGLPERTGEGVSAPGKDGVGASGHGHLPKSPVEIRSCSGLGRAFCPLSGGFRAAWVLSSASPKPDLGVSPPTQV